MIAQAGYEMFKSGQVTEWEDTFVTQRQVSECVRNLPERASLLPCRHATVYRFRTDEVFVTWRD